MRDSNELVIKSVKRIVPAASIPRATTSQTSPSPGEAEYIGRVLAALIIKGEITGAHIAKTTVRLRKLRQGTDPAAQTYEEVPYE